MRDYLPELENLKCCQFKPSEFLDLVKPKLKVFAGFFFCNKALIQEYFNWAIENKMNYDLLVMAKSNPIPAKNSHHVADLEYIVYIRAKGSYFSKHKQPFDDFRKYYLDTRQSKGRLHPAEKPLDLIERFVRVGSKEGDLILDPFLGSGTTALAAIKNNRNFIGFEMTAKYAELASKRIEEVKKCS